MSNQNIYQDLDKIVEERSCGKLVDPLDEQRLRDHQLRRLRRMWLQDQIISAREPLMPPSQKGVVAKAFSKVAEKENLFWSKVLDHKLLGDFLTHKNWKQAPAFLAHKLWRNVKKVTGFIILPVLPIAYYSQYVVGMQVDNAITSDVIYPGDKWITAKRQDFKWDPYSSSYVLKDGVTPIDSNIE